MAQKSQQAYLSVATAATAAKTVISLSNANPGVVGSTAHGLANGSVGIMTGVVGMTQVNNRAFIVANQATNTFELKGVNTTTLQGYGVWTSGGSFTPQTMAVVGEVRGITSAFDGEAADIDVTHLLSTGKEFLVGLLDAGNVSLNLWLPAASDSGQTRLRDLRETQSSSAFTITLAGGMVAAFVGLVKSFSVTGIEVDSVVACSCSIKVSNQPAFFA